MQFRRVCVCCGYLSPAPSVDRTITTFLDSVAGRCGPRKAACCCPDARSHLSGSPTHSTVTQVAQRCPFSPFFGGSPLKSTNQKKRMPFSLHEIHNLRVRQRRNIWPGRMVFFLVFILAGASPERQCLFRRVYQQTSKQANKQRQAQERMDEPTLT